MSDVERDDIREMRAQGDLAAFLRQQIAEGKARREKPPAVPPPRPLGYRAGAWPTGSRPPDPPPPQPPGAWMRALDDYREHLISAEHHGGIDADPSQTCDCKPCTDLRRNP
ncbi:hypothetical protein ACFC0S_16990 [Streptomyces sp. NPDC056084]|uniref:hypothetical protein n=1 Tax=unclassified Streptomyces TaxID=2593676 RepID=UPI0035D6132B